MKEAISLVVVCVLLITPATAWCQDVQPVRLSWAQLEPKLKNHKVALALPDGTRIEGKALAVEPGGLRLRITKSSNKSTQPKGEHLIPRQSVTAVTVTGYRKLGRIAGTAAAAGVTGAILAGSYPDIFEGPLLIIVPLVGAAGIIAAAIGGYYIGKHFDKRVTQIQVEPAGS